MKSLFALAITAGLLVSAPAHADNWKRAYCGGNDYIPAGGKYPHLHCGPDFFTFSKSSNNHANMVQGDEVLCGNTRNVIDNIKLLDNNVAGKQSMLDTVLAVARDYCKKKDGN